MDILMVLRLGVINCAYTGGQKWDHLSTVRRLRLFKQIPECSLIRHKVPGAKVLNDLHLAVVHVLLLHLDKREAALGFRKCAANLSFFTKFFWYKLHSWIPNLSDDVILSRIELVNAANLEINFLDHPEFQILGKLKGTDLNNFNQWERCRTKFGPIRIILIRSPRQWHEVGQFGKSWG